MRSNRSPLPPERHGNRHCKVNPTTFTFREKNHTNDLWFGTGPGGPHQRGNLFSTLVSRLVSRSLTPTQKGSLQQGSKRRRLFFTSLLPFFPAHLSPPPSSSLRTTAKPRSILSSFFHHPSFLFFSPLTSHLKKAPSPSSPTTSRPPSPFHLLLLKRGVEVICQD